MPEEDVNGTEGLEPEVKSYDESHVKKLNAEAASNRVRAKDAEAKVEDLTKKIQDFEDRDKTELERAQKKLAEAEATNATFLSQMREVSLRDKVIAECQKLQVIDAEAVYKMLNLSELDDDSKTVEKAVKGLVKNKQYLIKNSTPPSPGVGGPPIKGKPSADAQLAAFMKGGKR